MVIGRLIGSNPGVDAIFKTAFESLDNASTNFMDTIGSIETINAYFGGSEYRLILMRSKYNSSCYFRDACLFYENGTTMSTPFSSDLLSLISSVLEYFSTRHIYYFTDTGDRTTDLSQAVNMVIIDPCFYKTTVSGSSKIQFWSSYVDQNSPYSADFRRGFVDLSDPTQSSSVSIVPYSNNPAPQFEDVKVDFHVAYNPTTGFLSNNQIDTVVDAIEGPINQKFEALSSLFVSR